MRSVSIIAVISILLPIRMLMPLMAHMNAAVVTPVTFCSDLMMAPAPRNPIPVAICPIILVGSIAGFFSAR